MSNKVGQAETATLFDKVNLVLSPWLVFVVFSCLFAFVYHSMPIVVWLVFGMVLFFLLSHFWSGQGSAAGQRAAVNLFLAPLCLIGLLFGTVLGYRTYDVQMAHYWFLSESHTYTNVLPSDPAGAYVDGGKVLFVDDARVDSSKAMGYQDDSMFCVAPILDETSRTSAKKVEFWAAGVDCCGSRGDFVCDDAWNPNARGGAVIHEVSKLRHDLRDQYMLAVKQAEAAFEIASAGDPIFVRWVQDPEVVQENYWRVGCGVVLVSAAIYLLFSLVFVCIVGNSFGRAKDAQGAAIELIADA